MPARPAPSSPASDRPPVVPGYVVEELLGRGGSGQVWRARPRGGGPAVAVKVLVRGDCARQAREAALLGELDHPHLVHLHEVVRSRPRGGPEEVALVLDLLAGGSLAALLARRGRLRPGEVVTALAPVAAALAHAHDRGVVHGDLSPGNIVFTVEGRPVLTDLGVARVLGDAARAEVTPAYVDPTVARGGAPGPASDVFGVAAAAFHALTGVAPWNAASPLETLRVAAGGELPDLDLLAPEAPEQLRAVIRRGLAADPHERGSAAAFALDLRHACRPEPVRLPTPGVPDDALGVTGHGMRTELTHQVPGRRSRAVHAAPAPVSRWGRWRLRARLTGGDAVPVGEVARTAARRGATLVLVAAVLLTVGWLGTRWGGAPDAPAVVPAGLSGDRAPDTPTAQPPTPAGPTGDLPAPVSATPDVPTPDAPAPDPDVPATDPAPGDLAGWRDLVDGLYAQRAQAFSDGRAELLDAVYTPASELAAGDRAELGALAEAGQRLRGFRPVVARVDAAQVSSDRSVLHLVDSFPEYEVAPADPAGGGPVGTLPGRSPQQVTMVLLRTADGWRLDSAQRTGAAP